jgi:hypothetical protein
MKEHCTLCRKKHDVDLEQFADSEAYKNGTLICKQCGKRIFEWEASNLWCVNCGKMQRV